MADSPEIGDNTLDAISTTVSDTGMDTGAIASDGDVILVVGAPKSRFRVDSRCLSAASKVFKAMFSSKWSEGRDLSHSEPKHVALPEDDPFAIFVICCVVHHCNDKVPDSLAPQQLLEVAIAADKYDLSVALKYARPAWLNTAKGSGPELPLVRDGYHLAAAFAFKDPERFAKISFSLMVNHCGSYMALYKEEAIRNTLPDMTFRMLAICTCFEVGCGRH